MSRNLDQLKAKAMRTPVDAYWHGYIIDPSDQLTPDVKRCNHDHRTERTAQQCADKMLADYREARR